MPTTRSVAGASCGPGQHTARQAPVRKPAGRDRFRSLRPRPTVCSYGAPCAFSVPVRSAGARAFRSSARPDRMRSFSSEGEPVSAV